MFFLVFTSATAAGRPATRGRQHTAGPRSALALARRSGIDSVALPRSRSRVGRQRIPTPFTPFRFRAGPPIRAGDSGRSADRHLRCGLLGAAGRRRPAVGGTPAAAILPAVPEACMHCPRRPLLLVLSALSALFALS